MKQVHIQTVQDMLELSPEEFQRMLPDLVLWHSFTRQVQVKGMVHTGFLWTDDGQNEITAAQLTDTATGQMTEVKL